MNKSGNGNDERGEQLEKRMADALHDLSKAFELNGMIDCIYYNGSDRTKPFHCSKKNKKCYIIGKFSDGSKDYNCKERVSHRKDIVSKILGDN